MMTLSGLNVLFAMAPSTKGRYANGPLAPSIPQEAVMMARGLAASMRWARDAAANPPNTAA
jgi:hypothetical protein